MKPGTIFTKLIKTFGGSEDLSYIRNVFKGVRFDIEIDSLPCIMLEPTQNGDIQQDMNQTKNVWASYDVMGVAYNAYDQDLLFVGNTHYKGVYDIENDIRAVLQSSYTLGDTVIDIQFEPSVFNLLDFPVRREKYPARGVVIPIRVLYRQVDGE